jgi:hypothetical protein
MASRKKPDRQSGQAPRSFLRHVEERAIGLRRQAGVGPEVKLDPFAVARRFGVEVGYFEGLQLEPEDIQRLRNINARLWSGGAQQLPDGRLLVVLNPNQTAERAVSTVMEEISHAYLGHRPSALMPEAAGLIGRTFNDADEDEAYWTGAAALLPSVVVARAVWHEIPAETLASMYGVSHELVEFRIKTLRLWPWYRAYRVAA